MPEQPAVDPEFQPAQERGVEVGREVGAGVLGIGNNHLFDPAHEAPADTHQLRLHTDQAIGALQLKHR